MSIRVRHLNRRRLPSRSRRQTNRSRERPSLVLVDDDGTWTEVNQIRTANGGTCIDLTNSIDHGDDDDDIVDLTSPTRTTGTSNGLLRPIVVEGTSSTPVSPHRRRRRRERHRHSRPHGRGRSREDANENSVTVIDNPVSVINNDDDLPDPCLTSNSYQPELDTSANTSLNSPGARKITCPICMDDDKQIRRSGRQIHSTICGHIFCNECIRSAIEAQRACPSCRRKLTLRQTHPIFI